LTASNNEAAVLIARVAELADERIAPHAADVDKNARFPAEALEVMRELRLLSASLPVELGGLGLAPPELAAIASQLGRRCASSAMVFAMHEAQLESIRFGASGNDHFEAIMREIADDQLLIASVTSEAGIGGNIRASNAAADAGGERIVFEKQSPTLSYAEYCDAFLITARRASDAAESDQVLVWALKDEVELEKLGGWDTMGLRGTCSPPFKLGVDVPAENLIDAPFGVIASHRMVPWSHLLWAACWEGIASCAFDKAVRASRKKARKNLADGKEYGEPRLADAYSELQALRAIIDRFAAVYSEQATIAPDWRSAEQARVLTADAMSLKLNASMMSSRVAELALEIIGMAGFSESAPLSVTRQIRDLMGARLMVSNERLRHTSGQILLVGGDL
jgi:acyl-CoA dehydrogenase